jgi:hypothetical protein
MKKLTRIGTILLAVGLSLVILNLMRNSSTIPMTITSGVPPGKWSSLVFFFYPRDLELQIQSSSKSTILFLDPSNVTVFKAENITLASYRLHFDKRGNYNLSFYNPTNSSINVNMHLTFYNLEGDITLASIALITAGVVAIVAQKIYDVRHHRKESSA